jgi:hypothetical protein
MNLKDIISIAKTFQIDLDIRGLGLHLNRIVLQLDAFSFSFKTVVPYMGNIRVKLALQCITLWLERPLIILGYDCDTVYSNLPDPSLVAMQEEL